MVGVTLGVIFWGYIFGSLGLQKVVKPCVKQRGYNHKIFVKDGVFGGDTPPLNVKEVSDIHYYIRALAGVLTLLAGG